MSLSRQEARVGRQTSRHPRSQNLRRLAGGGRLDSRLGVQRERTGAGHDDRCDRGGWRSGDGRRGAPIPVRNSRRGRWPLRTSRRRPSGNCSPRQAPLELRRHRRLDQPSRARAQQLRHRVFNRRRRRQRNHFIVAHAPRALLDGTDFSQFDFGRDTPHNRTHPYATFDHGSASRRVPCWSREVLDAVTS